MDSTISVVDQESNQNHQAEAGASHLPSLKWELGTAYEFFISLHVLHHPEDFGLRASWAAGVRSRLDADARKTLEEAQQVIYVPLGWVYTLPEPKDAAGVLWALRQMPAEKRLHNLVFWCEEMKCSELADLCQDIADRKSWSAKEQQRVEELYREIFHKKHTDMVSKMLDIWADAASFGERLLSALQAYYQVFFAEEEKHLLPHLKAGMERAQELAVNLSLSELIEQLSQGIVFSDVQKHAELVLTPSFWSSPIIFFDDLSANRMMIVFGARPTDASLIPGEVVPDALLSILKAMADPTRLRILRYLAHESLSPAEIARRLRLRPPTVTHHLSALRLAGLVHLILEKEERQYTARLEVLEGLPNQILQFLKSPGDAGY